MLLFQPQASIGFHHLPFEGIPRAQGPYFGGVQQLWTPMKGKSLQIMWSSELLSGCWAEGCWRLVIKLGCIDAVVVFWAQSEMYLRTCSLWTPACRACRRIRLLQLWPLGRLRQMLQLLQELHPMQSFRVQPIERGSMQLKAPENRDWHSLKLKLLLPAKPNKQRNWWVLHQTRQQRQLGTWPSRWLRRQADGVGYRWSQHVTWWSSDRHLQRRGLGVMRGPFCQGQSA